MNYDVLKSWTISSLSVLIKRVLITKKVCILDASVVFKVLLYELFTVRLSQSFSFDHEPI